MNLRIENRFKNGNAICAIESLLLYKQYQSIRLSHILKSLLNILQKRSKVSKANWQNEEYRKRHSDKAKIYWSKQENHEKASKIQKEANKNPVVKARRSAAQKRFLADPERKELRRQKQLATKRAHNKDGSLSRRYANANHRRWENWTDEQKDAWLQKTRAGGAGYGRPSHFYSEKQNLDIYCDSKYELRFCQYIEQIPQVIEFRRFYYLIDMIGFKHRYKPDFVVKTKDKNYLIEVKSKYFAQDRLWPFKVEAAVNWCEDNEFEYRIVMEKELESLENYVKENCQD